MNKMSKTKVAAMTLSTLLMAVPALAADKTLTQTFDYQGEALHLNAGVGEVEIFASDSNQIEIEVELDGADTGFLFFGGSKDVSDIELDVDHSQGNRLILELTDSEDVKEHWRISLPAKAVVKLDLGVGRVESNGMDNSMDIDVGVGEVVVKHQHDYGDIELNSGVGDVSYAVDGKQVEVERAMVSASYVAQKAGDGELKVDVGVGEVSISKH